MTAFPLLLVFAATAAAQPTAFSAGPVFSDFGKIAPVEAAMPIPPEAVLRHSFDVSAAAAGRPNAGFDSIARFVNMHVAAGVPRANVRPAIVVHGPAALELMTDAAYRAEKRAANPSGALIDALVREKVPIYLCGQSAAAQGIAKSELRPGVTMALSAMTAHAILQQQGYTLNPF